MPSRRKRPETIGDKRRLIEAMRACRHEALTATGGIRPFCDTFNEVRLLTAAIDRLAGHHDHGSTGQSKARPEG